VRRLLKWSGIGLGGIVAVAVLAAFGLYLAGGARINRTFDVQERALAIPADSDAIARGRHLAEAVTLCTACHGDDLSGGPIADEPGIAEIYASNLTSGRGGVGSRYDDAAYVRAIRHGVNSEGRGILIMHADAYNHLGEQDLASIVAYVKSVPPVDSEVPRASVTALGRVMVALGLFDMPTMPLVPAEVIDHEAPIPDQIAPSVSAGYGAYLVSIALCKMCHGEEFRGGPPIEPGSPPAPDITVYGVDGGWSEEQFIATIRTGVTPYTRTLDGEVMPWETYANMTDAELAAIRLYVRDVAGS